MHALASVSPARRDQAAELMQRPASDMTPGCRSRCSGHRRGQIGPPRTGSRVDHARQRGNIGHLTSQFHRSSPRPRLRDVRDLQLLADLEHVERFRAASEQPGVTVCVYVDAEKGDPSGVKAKLPRATVYRSAHLPDGKPIVSHAKFIIIDHQIVLLTSANFSYSAENSNIEFGLRIRTTVWRRRSRRRWRVSMARCMNSPDWLLSV